MFPVPPCCSPFNTSMTSPTGAPIFHYSDESFRCSSPSAILVTPRTNPTIPLASPSDPHPIPLEPHRFPSAGRATDKLPVSRRRPPPFIAPLPSVFPEKKTPG